MRHWRGKDFEFFIMCILIWINSVVMYFLPNVTAKQAREAVVCNLERNR